jgi:macrolide transport system ATP-binding/permease protein
MMPLFRKLRWLVERRRKEAELSAELQFHLEEEAAERLERGMGSEEAVSGARRELGNLTLVQEDTRAAWGWRIFEQFVQDVRYAGRTMAANRIFSALAVLSLALGIGANTAIFSFMDAILLRSLPVADAGSLVRMTWHAHVPGMYGTYLHESAYRDPQTGFNSGVFPYPAFELFRKNQSLFSSVFGYNGVPTVNVKANGSAETVRGEYVSGDYFPGLGVPPAAGRLIYADDDRAGAPAVAAVSYAFAESRFGSAAGAAGQRVLIDNIPFTVAGVTGQEFLGVDPGQTPAVYLPMHVNLLLETGDPLDPPAKRYFDQKYQWVEVMARLRTGVTLEQAQAVLAPLYRQWAVDTAGDDDDRAHLPSLTVRDGRGGIDGLRREYGKPLFVLIAFVGLILALTCANLANLLLARSSARRREMAVRLAMGAARMRVIRQLLTESLLLACAGGVLGVGFAVEGIRFLSLLIENGADDLNLHAGLNWHVLAVAMGLCLVSGVLFGLAPALQSTRLSVLPALRESRTGAARTRRLGLSQVLVVSQIAISLLLLVGAGLFVRTLFNLHSIETGFNQKNLLVFRLDASHSARTSSEIAALYGDLLKQFRAIPGVRSASLSRQPLMGAGTSASAISVNGVRADSRKASTFLSVGPGFFTTMQIPVLRGREIDESDRFGAPLVAVVNEAFAKANFGDGDPLGQRVALESYQGPERREMTIVGVTGNALYGAVKKSLQPVLYFAYGQGSFPRLDAMSFELRTGGNPLGYVNSVREIVRRQDANLPVAEVATQAAMIDREIDHEILFARLSTGFALLALTIGCVGLYGTVTYSVARRTGEIGLRMALGARRELVVWMVLRSVLAVSAAGLAVSLPVALLASKAVKSFLYGMEPNDPAALTAAIVILMSSAVVAGYLPARRASRIDPMTVLRHE